jgi:mannose/fructose-specific phosphotransferase system component IIA
MSDVRGIVIGHGAMAAGMVDAVRQIAGIGDDVLVPLSNKGLSPDALISAVREKLVEGAETILFTDMQGGSCAVAARRLTRELPGTAVICGANLPVMLEFTMHRSLPMDALVARLLERGRSSISSPPSPAAEAAGQKKP